MRDRATLSVPAVARAVTGDVLRIHGQFLIYRQIPKGFARAAKPPRFKHPTFEAAEREAERLLEQHPECTFVILQEVAIVRAAAEIRSAIPEHSPR